MCIPGREVVLLPGLALALMESRRADWHAAEDEVTAVCAEVEVPSFDVLDMDSTALLLEKDAG